MIHRFLLCSFLFALIAGAQSEELFNQSKGESWSWGYGSEEGGSGSSYLGVDIDDVSPERLGELKLKEEHGAEVTMVDQDAPAGKAGLHEHDVILSVNGTAVESAAQLRRMIKETPPGRVVTLGISRDGQPLTLKVQLADRHKSMAWEPNIHVNIPKIPEIPPIPDIDLPISVVMVHSSARSGLMVENITAQLGEFFGVKDGKGVLVRSVEKGSRGDKSGFRAGDVIIKVNNQPVHDTSDFSHMLRSSSGGTATVTVMRDKKEQTLTLTIPPRRDSGSLLQDTLYLPDVTAETENVLNVEGDEIALLGPAMEKLQEQVACWKDKESSLKEKQEELKEKQREMEDQLKEQQEELKEREQELKQEEEDRQQAAQDQQQSLQDQQKEMQQELQERQQEMQREQQEQQRELQSQQEELQREQQELQQKVRQDLSRHWAEI